LAPKIVFEQQALVTEQDWIQAGALVFRAPIAFNGPGLRAAELQDPEWYEATGVGLTEDGIFPYARWVIREKGKLELGEFSCATCHTRLMPDGTSLEGAQGNFPFEDILVERHRRGALAEAAVRFFSHALTDTPWRPSKIGEMSVEELIAARDTIPAGVLLRQGTALEAPARVPDLIGIEERRYLDATGLVRHRDMGDLMRYAAANQGMDMLARYGDYVPATSSPVVPPPGRSRFPGSAERYSDAQLYALALYLYSLEPPPNPNAVDDLVRRGQEIFEGEGCSDCHTPPLYTNNMLIPATGFKPPADHYENYDVSRRKVGTDPTLAMETRRGTGYYKIPSLKGLWYRGPLTHSGAIARLEDWFDPARLEDDYQPTGFAPAGASSGPVLGHPFGIDLLAEDKRALIAFLRTL
jgi:mono/diheme cytochrome c family protein